MRIHFIAIGGAAMHNMAICMHKKGYIVTGSDDEIREPSLSRLKQHGILPVEMGWHPEKITKDLDAIILGMHARLDNPELIKAQELGVRIYSYPEYIYEQTKDKTRIVIGGSHGKTTITAMILHVFKQCGIDTDYMVGAALPGFDTMVKLTNEAKYVVVEGDEYLASPIDKRPKFHLYHPHIAIISGIAWDHINVFPTYDIYVDQFRQFIRLIEPGGTLVYCQEDKDLNSLANEMKHKRTDLYYYPYGVPENSIENGETILIHDKGKTRLHIFGEHNLMNLNGARLVCNKAGISDEQFYNAISSFKGAARRLELVYKNEHTAYYKDFAHSPSKLKATTDAVKKQYPNRKLVACMELHTFSSLNEDFLKEYKGAMDLADKAIVYFNPQVIEHKKLKPITVEQVKEAFGREDLMVLVQSKDVLNELKSRSWDNTNLLMMTSGNFDGIDLDGLGKELLN